MSTRNGGVSPEKYGLNMSFTVGDEQKNVEENRRRFFSGLEISQSQIAFPIQNHTTNICSVNSAGEYKNTDALITNTKNLFLAISVADCNAVMLFDSVTQTIAGVHAGWRGTVGKIVSQTIEMMEKQYFINPKNLIAFIGPSARKCCYEVEKDVAQEFSSKFLKERSDDKFLLDVPSANVEQLVESGVLENNIEIHPDCTICSSKTYHSYRCDKEKAGRMLAVIGMKVDK